MRNPTITIDSTGNITDSPSIVMMQDENFRITNESSESQFVHFGFAGKTSKTIQVPGNSTNREFAADFVADRLDPRTSPDPTPPDPGGVTGIIIKQMSQTGATMGLGFIWNGNFCRVQSNVGIRTVQADSRNRGTNYTLGLRLFTCLDGRVVLGSEVGGACETWRVPSGDDALTFDGDLQDTCLFELSRNTSGGFTLTSASKSLVFDHSKGIVLRAGAGTVFHATARAPHFFSCASGA